MARYRDTFTRFIRRLDNGCLVWVGANNPNGYGKYRGVLAHREAYGRAYGPIPDGFCVCHTCDNPPCVNPEHLWLGTKADNTADMLSKGRNRWRLSPSETRPTPQHWISKRQAALNEGKPL